MDKMEIDIESLRSDMVDECLAAHFGGGIGVASIESIEIQNASPQKLIQIANRMNIDIENYIVYPKRRGK